MSRLGETIEAMLRNHPETLSALKGKVGFLIKDAKGNEYFNTACSF